MRKQTREEATWRFLGYTFVLLVTLLMMVPIYWIIVASTLPEQAFLSAGTDIQLLPGANFLANLEALQARESVDFIQSIWNSVFIAVVYTVLSLVLCSMGGFAFAKYEFRFKEPIFYSILATLTLPIQLLVIPLFLLISQMGLTNSYWAIILPWAANPLGIFLMRQNMKQIPDALLESARIDGATEFQLYYRIALPTMKSSLAALAIVLFLFQWNLFLFPLVVLEQGKYTIPVAINELVGAQRVYYDQIMVAAALSIIPLFIVFLFLQRHFVSGILAGSVKE
ncbi:carbohydrate ABC transporter permease [Haloarcula marismortui]|jgi:lactose/L-arabinose transport system permease protein|uniref:Binding-protein-dependent transport systems inner membrane component n=1 Tax=Haloarcula marismortui ATCC 33800 TaxID=662476 RepID=M0JU97_9EURY|nr:carbohydrate ABC transporter permease [Haloarcula sinaiiensis]EMA11250.1 binding-protein-dependent transport systems inner membrane component [Haloarcula sinaiiensis ATCC 33800]QUJ73779.1 carbohydrate ABC transporter permease [Haloarcula sinaiiensis ATCC 33800]